MSVVPQNELELLKLVYEADSARAEKELNRAIGLLDQARIELVSVREREDRNAKLLDRVTSVQPTGGIASAWADRSRYASRQRDELREVRTLVDAALDHVNRCAEDVARCQNVVAAAHGRMANVANQLDQRRLAQARWEDDRNDDDSNDVGSAARARANRR